MAVLCRAGQVWATAARADGYRSMRCALTTMTRRYAFAPWQRHLSGTNTATIRVNAPPMRPMALSTGEMRISVKKYFQDLEARMTPKARSTTAPTCKQYNKQSLYSAIKCANPDRGSVFVEGIAGPKHSPDRCPTCGKSETEESRKRRLSDT